jgi:hypothetical protein
MLLQNLNDSKEPDDEELLFGNGMNPDCFGPRHARAFSLGPDKRGIVMKT